MILCLMQIAAIFSATAGEADWPQFRGPQGNGVAAPQADPPVEWSETKNIRWKAEVPGGARSSPLVLGDRIYLTTAEPTDLEIRAVGPDNLQFAPNVALGAVCLDRATGKRLWKTTLFELKQPGPVHVLNSFATPTPCVEPGRLYCDFGAYGTACVNTELGEAVWKQKLPIEHQVGPGSSPVLYKDLFILVRDGCDAQYITALDKQTGKEVWKTNRPPLTGDRADLKKAFSTPLIFEADGKTQMVVPGAQWVASYDPATGKEIWRVRHGEGASLASRPVAGHGMVYFTTGMLTQQFLAVRTDGEGDVTDTHIAWRVTTSVPSMPSPLLVGDELFAVTDTGIACCLDALTGEVRWRHRLGGSFLASPTFAAGRIYFFNQDGKGTVIEAKKEFSLLAENELPGPVVASPAVVGHAIYLRSDNCLYRIEQP